MKYFYYAFISVALCVPSNSLAQNGTTRTSGGFIFQHNDPANETLCSLPNARDLPQCQNRTQDNSSGRHHSSVPNGFDRPSTSNQFVYSAPIIDRATILNYRPVTIIEIPQGFVRDDLPPYWMHICRTIDPNSQSSDYIPPIEVKVDYGTPTKINERGCTYVPFRQSIIASTQSRSINIEYQFLGRN